MGSTIMGGHALTVDVPSDPLVVDADPARLAQVIANLLTNAAKYTGRGGSIALTARREGGAAVVSVKDTGVGLPPDMLTKVFDMFTQVDTSLERSQGGLGIGLTLVKRLTEMHGGTVAAFSAGAGRGSEFVVRLPVAAAEPVPVRDDDEGAARPVPRTALRILVADDNADSADSLADLLGLVGHEVVTAGDGQEAVDKAEAFRPDVVLTDIGMPRLNGYEVARALRLRPWAKGVTIVALTGWGQEDDKRARRTRGSTATWSSRSNSTPWCDCSRASRPAPLNRVVRRRPSDRLLRAGGGADHELKPGR